MTNLHLLSKALKANAAFSFFCGSELLLFSTWFQAQLGGLDLWVYQGIGAGLILFAVDVLFVSLSEERMLKWAKAIIFSDVAWVAGSLVVLAVSANALPLSGIMLITAVTLVVGIFAVLQWRGLTALPSISR